MTSPKKEEHGFQKYYNGDRKQCFLPRAKLRIKKKKKALSSKTLLCVFNSRKASLVKLGLDGFQMQILLATLGELDIIFESD